MWEHERRWYHTVELDAENARRAELNKPLPKPDPDLVRPTTIRCLKAFRHDGRVIEPGELVYVPYHVARDLYFQQKAEPA
jgi:hypothetical protein